jgi:hypothetical protein
VSKRGEWAGDSSFGGGEQSDLPPHLIPENGLLLADNVVLSRTGRLSKRGPVQPYLLNARSDNVQKLAQYKLNTYNPPYRGFAMGQNSNEASRWFTFDLTNPPTADRAGNLNAGEFYAGATAAQNAAFNFRSPPSSPGLNVKNYLLGGPAFNYLGLPFFPAPPVLGTEELLYAFAGKNSWAGQPAVSPVAAGSVTVTAGDPDIYVPNALLPAGQAADYAGNFVYIYLGSATPSSRRLYIGVITSSQGLTPNTLIRVYPTPRISFAGSCFVGVAPFASGPRASIPNLASTLYSANAFPPSEEPLVLPNRVLAACSHQNRIVVAPDRTWSLPNPSATFATASRTESTVISWSAISGEPGTASSTGADGILPLQVAGWPRAQSITLDTAGIVSLVSMDANNLMVLCSDKTFMISGTLGTILPGGGVNTSSFNIRTVAQSVGCIDNNTVQRTPVGVMFAGQDGVYVTDGTSFRNTMENRIQIKWNTIIDEIAEKSLAITGSAVIGGTHYVIFTQSKNFICDLYNDFVWTTMSVGTAYGGGRVSYGYGIQDWRGRSEVYAPKINQTHDNNAYCDKITLVDSILYTDNAIQTDVPNNGSIVDGEFAYSVDAGSPTPLNASFWTRAYTFGDPSSLKAYKTMTATYLSDQKFSGADPISTYVAEGLQPTPDTSVAAYSTVEASPVGNTAPLRVSFLPRIIDNGVSFGFKTNFVRADSPQIGLFSSLCRFSLYQLALNFIKLRKGRTFQ